MIARQADTRDYVIRSRCCGGLALGLSVFRHPDRTAFAWLIASGMNPALYVQPQLGEYLSGSNHIFPSEGDFLLPRSSVPVEFYGNARSWMSNRSTRPRPSTSFDI
jgi:hypothetical protein